MLKELLRFKGIDSTVKIVSMKPEVEKKEAVKCIQKIERDIAVDLIQSLYYPYIQFKYRVILKVPKIFRKIFRNSSIEEKVVCFIDLIGGSESLSVKSAKIEEIEVLKACVLFPKDDLVSAQKRAKSYIINVFINKLKILKAPDLFLQDKKIIYKPFFLFRCRNNKKRGRDSFVIFDTVGGQMQALFLSKKFYKNISKLESASLVRLFSVMRL